MKKIFQLLILALAVAAILQLVAIFFRIYPQNQITTEETQNPAPSLQSPAPASENQNKATVPPPAATPVNLPSKPSGSVTDKMKSGEIKPAPKPSQPVLTSIVPESQFNANTLPTPSTPRLSDQEIYSNFSAAIVQIFCSTREELFSASGVIINGNGLVLTNAHVARNIEKIGEEKCQARHGNPAETFAKIRVVFVPDTTPRLPGNDKIYQRDFAFLKIMEPKNPFNVVSVSLGIAEKNTVLLTLGYPSEFLESVNTSSNSNLVFSALNVDGYADVDGDLNNAEGYVFNGGLILQQGSSGTALFSRAGEMVGIIFATTKEKTTAERQGIALMMSYIDRILKLETGQRLADFIKTQ